MHSHAKRFPPRPFYHAGNRCCSVEGVTIHLCKDVGEAMQLAQALNTAMNDVLLTPASSNTDSDMLCRNYGGTTSDD